MLGALRHSLCSLTCHSAASASLYTTGLPLSTPPSAGSVGRGQVCPLLHHLKHGTGFLLIPFATAQIGLTTFIKTLLKIPGVKKKIKENNLGDTNKLPLHEADGLHLENCQMEWKPGSFL